MNHIVFTVASRRRLAHVQHLMREMRTQYPHCERVVYLLDAEEGFVWEDCRFVPAAVLFEAEDFGHRSFVYTESIFEQVVAARAARLLFEQGAPSLTYHRWACHVHEVPQGWESPCGEHEAQLVVEAGDEAFPPLDVKYLYGLNDRRHLYSPAWRMGRGSLPFWQFCCEKFDFLTEKGIAQPAAIGYRLFEFHRQGQFYHDWLSYIQQFDVQLSLLPYGNLALRRSGALHLPVMDFTQLVLAEEQMEPAKLADYLALEYPDTTLEAYTQYRNSLEGPPSDVPYAFGRFEDGTEVLDVLRTYYAWDYRLQNTCERRPFVSSAAFFAANVIAGDTSPLLYSAAMAALWQTRGDLQRMYPDICGADRTGYLQWYLGHGAAEYTLPAAYTQPAQNSLAAHQGRLQTVARQRPALQKIRDRLAQRLTGVAPAIQLAPTGNADVMQAGVNLCGYARGDFGVAESLRIVATTLEAAGIPFTIVDYEPRENYGHTFRDESWRHKISNRFCYNTNLIVANPPDTREFIRSVAPEAVRGRYNIGYWAWELPEFPENWLPFLDCVDEIWANSQFAVDCHRTVTDKPTFVLPCCIQMRELAPLGKADFGLREDAFAFLMMYDVRSSLERKNPGAVVEAFLSRFSGNSGVQLAIKVSAPPDWEFRDEISRLVKQHENLVYLTGTYPRAKVNALLGCCDALVSLHRSEGFGLAPAEAMYLGKPAVLTNWSGNTQYMTADNCCPVRCSIVPIQNNEQEYRRGRHWAQPDVEHAAEYMQRLVQDPAYYRQVSINAQKYIREELNAEKLGQLARTQLEATAFRDGGKTGE